MFGKITLCIYIINNMNKNVEGKFISIIFRFSYRIKNIILIY